MDAVVQRCIRERSRLGYFAALYRDVTVGVRAAIAANEFEDAARMERLDVIFATRYLTAIDLYWQGKAPTLSWLAAFRTASQWRPIVLQHLLLGMHAHINLDLAIAAALAAPGAELPALKKDFEKITILLNRMIDDVQRRIVRVSPWFYIIDRAGGRSDERLVNFGIGEARTLSWRAAERLANVNRVQFDWEVELHDRIVATLARGIQSPGPVLASALQVIRLRENASVPAVIEALSAR